MHGLLDNVTLVLFPKSNSKVSSTRVKIWQSNGASVRFQIPDDDANDNEANVTYLVLTDTDNLNVPQLLKQLNIKSLSQIKVPVVKLAWLFTCLEQNKLVSHSDFLYQLPKVDPTPTLTDDLSANPRKRRKLLSLSSSQQQKQQKSIMETDQCIRLISKLTRLRDQKANHLSRRFARNDKIIGIFQEMISLLEQETLFESVNTHKARQYRNAITAIQDYNFPIRSSADLSDKPGIGKSICEHIDDIIETGSFPKFDVLKRSLDQNRELRLVNQLSKIHGFGQTNASVFIKKYGITDFCQLSESKIYNRLNRVQKIGYQYRDDWSERMTRDEVTCHFKHIKNLVREFDPNLQIEIMGSYLRG
ncbi:unnamed protein product [Ambrosiozyma monospora]|uniref:DNA polymerase n=1 Tax=Ambrosiozyma monospora TaxID=43982 RepID=A0A9W6YPR1_AMBMO|nr:unnamed protein product [Ambrosiozyma monospora]